MKNYETFKHIILAGGIGDAFGYQVEFQDTDWITSLYGEQGIKLSPSGLVYRKVSDDTQMTLFCLDTVNNYLNVEPHRFFADKFIHDMHLSYMEWLKTQFLNVKFNPATNALSKLTEFSVLWKREAPGNTCLGALGSQRMGLIGKGQFINDSKGCGGIMRTAPIAFLKLPLDVIFDLGARQAAITHGHADGYLPSGFFAGLLSAIMDGSTFDDAFNANIKLLKTYDNHESFLIYITDVLNLTTVVPNLWGKQINQMIGAGWIGDEACGVAMYCVLTSPSFEEAVNRATNHDGDSDSTATLAAQLWVAMHGLDEAYHDDRLNVNPALKYLFDNMQAALENSDDSNIINK